MSLTRERTLIDHSIYPYLCINYTYIYIYAKEERQHHVKIIAFKYFNIYYEKCFNPILNYT